MKPRNCLLGTAEHMARRLDTDGALKPEYRRPDLVERASVPDYALGAHTASLGLVNAAGNALSPQWQQGMFIGQHGSWNRKPRSVY